MKDDGDCGSRSQCSSGKVVCEIMRWEPVMTEEFRSDLICVRSGEEGGKGVNGIPEDCPFDAVA